MSRTVPLVFLSALSACFDFGGDFSFDPSPPSPPPDNDPPPSPDCTHCEPTLPLDFDGVQPLAGNFPDQANLNNHIAVGGTHEVTLRFDGGTEFNSSYDTSVLHPNLLRVDHAEGARIVLHGVAAGQTDLRITEPATGVLYDRAAYAMSELSRAVPVGVEEGITSVALTTPAQRFVFAPGARRVGIAYLNAHAPANRLVDTSATITADGATQMRWDEITFDDATVGTHVVAVTAGGRELAVEVEVVAAADSIQLLLDFAGIACFGAFSGPSGDAFIAGIPWTLTIDGETYPPDSTTLFGRNCVVYDSATPHTIVATAGGKTLAITK